MFRSGSFCVSLLHHPASKGQLGKAFLVASALSASLMTMATPSSAVELPDKLHWTDVGHRLCWTKYDHCDDFIGPPFDPFPWDVGPDGDIDYDSIVAGPGSGFVGLTGSGLGYPDGDGTLVVDDAGTMLQLDFQLENLLVEAAPPTSFPTPNAVEVGLGVWHVDLAGHVLTLNQGTASFSVVNLSTFVVEDSGEMDFGATPLEMTISSGLAVIKGGLAEGGLVSIEFETEPSPSLFGDEGIEFSLTGNLVPEPSTITLFFLGLVGLGHCRRRLVTVN